MACSMAKDLMDGFHPPEKVAANPSTAYPLDEIPLSAAWTTTAMPDSLARPQKPSNIGSKGLRRPERRGRRRRPHDHGPGPVVEGPGQLLGGPGRVGQRDVGGGEDPVAEVERPVLGQPAVEGPEQVAHRLGIVGQGLLVDHPEGGEQQASGQSLLRPVWPGGPRAGGRPGGWAPDGTGTPSGSGGRGCPGSSRTWPRQGHGVERRIGHRLADPSAR